jgi:hypothetical protein
MGEFECLPMSFHRKAPIKVRQIEKPDLPDWPGGPEVQPPRPGLPEDWRERVRDYIQEKLEGLPPPEEWPPLLPFLQPGVGLPIPPNAEHPMVLGDPHPLN